METGTFNDRTLQDGHDDITWVDDEGVLSPIGIPGGIGMVFDFSDWSGNYIVRPSAMAFEVAPFGEPANAVGVYYVPEVEPGLYSDLALPGSRGENARTLICEVYGDPFIIDEVFEFQLGYRYQGGEWRPDGQFKQNLSGLLGLITSEDWNGRIALSIISDTEVGPYFWASDEVDPDVILPSVTVDYWKHHTGRRDVDLTSGRAVHDMKTGLPALASELVEDGYRKGVWTRPDQWDDEDRRGESELPSTEGKIRDRVPE